MDKNEFLDKIKRWSAPYSPFAPLEIDDAYNEMRESLNKITENDFSILMDISSVLEGEQYDVFMEFMYFYIDKYKITLKNKLFEKLSENESPTIIELIGFVREQSVYWLLINKIHYENLNFNSKIALIDTLQLLKNKNAISFLETQKLNEKNIEVLESINSVINYLAQ